MKFLGNKETYCLDLRVFRRILLKEGFRTTTDSKTTETSKESIIRIHYKNDILDRDQYKIAEIRGGEIVLSDSPLEEREKLENLLKRLDEGRYP